jgi:hypothetical protein
MPGPTAAVESAHASAALSVEGAYSFEKGHERISRSGTAWRVDPCTAMRVPRGATDRQGGHEGAI